jgi:hypothetical protein
LLQGGSQTAKERVTSAAYCIHIKPARNEKEGRRREILAGAANKGCGLITIHPETSAMLILFVLLVLGMLAISWLVYEPISGIVGSAFIAKIMAFVVAFKLISAVAGWIMGPAVVRIPL